MSERLLRLLAKISTKKPAVVVLVFLVLVALSIYSAQNIRYEFAHSTYFSKNDPVYQQYTLYQKDFEVGTENAFIFVKADNIFSKECLEYIDKLSKSLKEIVLQLYIGEKINTTMSEILNILTKISAVQPSIAYPKREEVQPPEGVSLEEWMKEHQKIQEDLLRLREDVVKTSAKKKEYEKNLEESIISKVVKYVQPPPPPGLSDEAQVAVEEIKAKVQVFTESLSKLENIITTALRMNQPISANTQPMDQDEKKRALEELPPGSVEE